MGDGIDHGAFWVREVAVVGERERDGFFIYCLEGIYLEIAKLVA